MLNSLILGTLLSLSPIIDEVVEAVAWVESRYDEEAYNAYEDAVGYLQIRPIMVEEINRLMKLEGRGTRFSHEDAWDKCKSTLMFRYLHCRLGREWQETVRIWNGGYKFNNNQTLIYLNKVKDKLCSG